MKAIQISMTGGPEVLQVRDVQDPKPNQGEVLIRTHTAGVNFIDVYYREGKYKAPLPFIPGGEGSGYIEAIGEGVEGFAIGDAVAWYGPLGGYAELASVKAGMVVKVPQGLDLATAAALMMQGITAHYLAYSTFPLQRGQTALVHAAAGGVGALLTQLAVARGARVIATVSTEEKAEIARQAGAHEVILYSQQEFDKEARRLTNGEGVDVVYDGVGKSTFEQSLKSLKRLGTLALYGAASGPVPPFDLARLSAMGSLFVTRPWSLDYVATREKYLERVETLFDLHQRGCLQVRIDRTFPLEEASQAHIRLESREALGKVLLAAGASA